MNGQNSNPSSVPDTEQIAKQRLPPGQQLVGAEKWPIVGEREPLPTEGLWQLEITGAVHRPLQLNLNELIALPQTRLKMDIHCVTRWSKYDVTFEGIALKHVLDLAGLKSDANFISFVANTERQHSTSLTVSQAIDHQTLLALSANGEPLLKKHGGPLRNVVPGKYFYKSVKWLHRIEILTEDRLGYWEAETGYHNHADPWKEERFMAPNIDRRTAAKLIANKSFANQDLRSLNASRMNLSQLDARSALLRNADFRYSDLTESNFQDANLSNARFRSALLSKSSFLRADLEGADFAGADLRNSDLTNASLFGASFCDVENGQILNPANMDKTTLIHPSQLENLTETQFQFVTTQLGLSE